jgi:Mn2+/Fe2+ NRAMP family transporter
MAAKTEKEVALGTRLSALGPVRINKVPVLGVSILAMLGPAYIWACVAMGSGELIWWPYMAAKYGLAFVGILLPALVIQYWVNQEIARYTALTGEGPWSAFARIGKWFTVPFWILFFVGYLWFGGYASAGGTGMRDLVGWPVDPAFGSRFWGLVIMIIFLIGLVFSRVVYIAIEWFMRVLTVVIIVGVIVAALRPEVFAVAGSFLATLFNPIAGLRSMFNPGAIPGWDPKDTARIVTGIAYAGMGGFWNLLYAYWIRDKGVAMARYVGRITSPITGEPEAIPGTGYAFEDTEENKRNWQAWLRYLRVDNFVAVGLNGFVCILMMLLALAFLHPERLAPAGWKIAVEQARILEAVWGPIGRALFLLVGFAFLGDTWFAATDGIARQHAEFIWTQFEWAKKWSYRWWYYAWVGFLTVITVITMFIAAPGPLLLILGVISIFAFVFFIPVLMYLNYVKIPQVYPAWVRPSPITMVLLAIIWLIYLGVAVWFLVLAPERIPYFIALIVMWIIVGGYFYLRERGKLAPAA